MSEDDPEFPKEEEIRRTTSPEYRMLELIEKLNARVDTNAEETQHKMDFIVNQQAQFTIDLQQMREVNAEEIKQLREVQANTEILIGRLATVTLERITNLEEKVTVLIDSHIKLADAQTHTDERLGVFITTVERYVSEKHNGESQG